MMVEPPDDTDLPVLFFTEVPEDKVVKNRVHVDVAADPRSRTRSGASRDSAPRCATGRRRTGAWCVMADPQGNEFCVVPSSEAD